MKAEEYLSEFEDLENDLCTIDCSCSSELRINLRLLSVLMLNNLDRDKGTMFLSALMIK